MFIVVFNFKNLIMKCKLFFWVQRQNKICKLNPPLQRFKPLQIKVSPYYGRKRSYKITPLLDNGGLGLGALRPNCSCIRHLVVPTCKTTYANA